MNKVLLIAAVALCLGLGFWIGKRDSLELAVVDMNRLIHQTAESLARKNLAPEQTQFQITKFKNDVQLALKEFAKINKILIFSSHCLFGDVPDKTEAFIRFYNEGASS